MKRYDIAVIPGDGIGQEVTPEGVRVLDAVAQVDGGFQLRYEQFPWGCEYPGAGFGEKAIRSRPCAWRL